jgi:hypothetical protein
MLIFFAMKKCFYDLMGQDNYEKGYVLVLGKISREFYIELIVLFDCQVLASKKLI